MSQVVSRNLGDSQASPAAYNNKGELDGWRAKMRLAFHGVAASTYGYAICWQNVSEASAQLYSRQNPLMRAYGKWRFLTYNCLMMQFVAYSLCFAAHFVPKLRRPRDYFFTTFAFPVGMVVVGSFWAIWFTLGREFIFPISVEPFYPPWLNHVTHTIIAPVNLIEVLTSRKQFTERKSYLGLAGYSAFYATFILYIRYQTGRFVYPFLNNMDATSASMFIVGMVGSVMLFYKTGKFLHDLVYGSETVRSKQLSGKGSKKKN